MQAEADYETALGNIRRLLADIADEYEADEGIGGDGEPFGPEPEVLNALREALAAIDRAMAAL